MPNASNFGEACMISPLRHTEGSVRSTAHLAPVVAAEDIAVCLNAAIFAVRGDEPVVAVIPARHGERMDSSLPSGLFSTREHDSLEGGLRDWVRRQTGLELGFAQQLCTFEERSADCGTSVVVSISYIALVGPDHSADSETATWRSWYAFFPWEDWRRGRPKCLTSDIEPALGDWAKLSTIPCAVREPLDRAHRVRMCFGLDGAAWDDEKVLERYDLLCEAGVIGAAPPNAAGARVFSQLIPTLGHSIGDQARVLASGIGQLRRTVKSRPVIFELMPEVFTLFELQKTVEAILGPHLHKQNFRRLVEAEGLVEPTGQFKLRTGGRPAQLYRFRRDVLWERPAPGVRVKPGRA
jgi:hypothetical protein